MRNELEKSLLSFKRKTITVDELGKIFKTKNYEQFSTEILALEKDGTLEMVKAKGRTSRTPSLAVRYKINKHSLNKNHYKQLQTYRMKFHDAINLDTYFTIDHAIWAHDLPYLEKINTYIEKNGFPTEQEPAPGRSFQLVGNEKWLEEGGGVELLERINLWEKMKIAPVSDPLMFAINPYEIESTKQYHLIVENKTTYQALLPALIKSTFSTLIYGAGNKIPKSIENFHDQYPAKAAHTFFYFGDIDRAGITIWHSLSEREQVIPARPFYEACLTKKEAYGKTNQRKNEQAVASFITFFSENSAQRIRHLLENGAYYPQEVLETKELQKIWLETNWQTIIR